MPDGGDGSGRVYPYDERQYRKVVPLALVIGIASVLLGGIWLVHILGRVEPGIPFAINLAFDFVAVLFFGMFIVGGSWIILWVSRLSRWLAEYVWVVTEDALIFHPGSKETRVPWPSIARIAGPLPQERGGYVITTSDGRRLGIRPWVVNVEELIAQIAERSPNAARG